MAAMPECDQHWLFYGFRSPSIVKVAWDIAIPICEELTCSMANSP